MDEFRWEKVGRIFDPAMLKEKGLFAALMPVPRILDYNNDIIRIYYSPRDKENRSEVHFFDINLNNPTEILKMSETPLIKHGKLGTFDDNGITMGNIIEVNNKRVLYYTGWNLLKNVPMNNSIGIAEFDENENLKRYGDGPILTRTLYEPYSCASPFVMYDRGMYRMWYASNDKWIVDEEIPKHYYNIKYAESNDGIVWQRNCHVAIDYNGTDEYAFGKPWVIKENGIYKMWYSYRGDYYKIGYAESKDGLDWTRYDYKAGISVSDNGWDSEMIEYPSIFDHKNERYMLYNGNGYGKTGIGLAILTR